MLAKSHRLSAVELNFVREVGDLYRGDLYNLLAFQLKDQRPVRLGAIVSRRVVELAVKRNWVRRQFWQSWAPLIGSLPAGWLVCGLMKKASLKATPDQFLKEASSFLKRLEKTE